MRPLKTNGGQFIPISAMVMFTIMVFMVAVVNIYKVSRTKLKVQNLADAAALNLASQEAQAYNTVTDKNDWMNRMMAGEEIPTSAGDCEKYNMGKPNDLLMPPITCVENNLDPKSTEVFKKRVWQARGDPTKANSGAIGYANLIYTINTAQKLFVKAYNSFIGDRTSGIGSGSSTSGPGNFEGLLKADIPDLDDPAIHLIAWNRGELSLDQAQEMVKQSDRNFISRMEGLRFKVHHDIATRIQTDKGVDATTFGQLLFGRVNYGKKNPQQGPFYGQPFEAVGWMVPDQQPTIPVNTGQGSKGDQVGVGVYVSQNIQVPIVGNLAVGAKAKAYVVKGSGETGDKGGFPIFKPTYWVKLAN